MKLKLGITKKGAIISLFVLVFGWLIDFFSKLIVMKNMAIGQSIPLINNVLHITFIINRGAAFGSLSEKRWLFMIMSSVLIVGLILLILFWDKPSPLFYVASSLVLTGGIGNMTDRIAYGYVVDFIDFCAFPNLWQWIFNFADSFVCVGAGLLIVWYICEEVKNYRKSKNGETTKGSENDEV